MLQTVSNVYLLRKSRLQVSVPATVVNEVGWATTPTTRNDAGADVCSWTASNVWVTRATPSDVFGVRNISEDVGELSSGTFLWCRRMIGIDMLRASVMAIMETILTHNSRVVHRTLDSLVRIVGQGGSGLLTS